MNRDPFLVSFLNLILMDLITENQLLISFMGSLVRGKRGIYKKKKSYTKPIAMRFGSPAVGELHCRSSRCTCRSSGLPCRWRGSISAVAGGGGAARFGGLGFVGGNCLPYTLSCYNLLLLVARFVANKPFLLKLAKTLWSSAVGWYRKWASTHCWNHRIRATIIEDVGWYRQ